jgi:hypothetical protein
VIQDPVRCGFHIHLIFVFDELDQKNIKEPISKYFTAVSYDGKQIRQRWLLHASHRDLSVCIERLNMHCHGFARIRSFDKGLTSAEGKKLECFK